MLAPWQSICYIISSFFNLQFKLQIYFAYEGSLVSVRWCLLEWLIKWNIVHIKLSWGNPNSLIVNLLFQCEYFACKGFTNMVCCSERANLAVTLINQNDEIMGQACFLDYPNIGGVDPGKWEDWLHSSYNKTSSSTSLNTLFLHLFVARLVCLLSSKLVAMVMFSSWCWQTCFLSNYLQSADLKSWYLSSLPTFGKTRFFLYEK